MSSKKNSIPGGMTDEAFFNALAVGVDLRDLVGQSGVPLATESKVGATGTKPENSVPKPAAMSGPVGYGGC